MRNVAPQLDPPGRPGQAGHPGPVRRAGAVALALACASAAVALVQAQSTLKPQPARTTSTMANPYTLTPAWPTLGPGMKWGGAIGIIPDGKGGTWMHFRSEPPIIHFDASGKIVKTFADGMFVQAHGFCQDKQGNFWAGDSGPFGDDPKAVGRGYQVIKFSPEGKVLLTLGMAALALGPTVRG